MAVPMEEWRLPEKRRMIVQKLEEAFSACSASNLPVQRPPHELEQFLFEKAKSGEEYTRSLQQLMLKLARGSTRRQGPMQQAVVGMPPGVDGQAGVMQQGQMGMSQQGGSYNQSQFQQYQGGMRPSMGMGQTSQPPGYGHPMYQRPPMAPHPNQMMGQMRIPNQQQVYQSTMIGGQGSYSGMGGPRYNVHPNIVGGGIPLRGPGVRPGVPGNVGGPGMGMPGSLQNSSSSSYQGHSVQTINNPSYPGSTVPQNFSQAASRPEAPPTSVPSSTSSSAEGGAKTQQSSTGGNPPTPHPPSMPGGVPSPAPPTPLLPASPATSNVGSPAPQPIITPEENEVYIRKLSELQKFIPLLQKWISKLNKEDKNNQLPKLKQLYHLLTNSNKRVPITTLMRCGEALDKMLSNDQASRETHPSTSSDAPTPQPRATPPTPINEPVVPTSKLMEPRHSPSLLEFKIPQSPPANYESVLEAIHTRPLPSERLPPAKRICNRDEPAIPHSLLREIATIFNVKVKKLPNDSGFDKSTILHCTLNDEDLPTVPPLTIRIPSGYPLVSPVCDLSPYQTSSSSLVTEVGRTLADRLSKSVHTYTLSALISDWEMCVLRAMSKKLAAVENSL